MKKNFTLKFFALATCAILGTTSVFADYCYYAGNSTHTEGGGRYLPSLTISDGANTATVTGQSGIQQAIYCDRTDTKFTTTAGATITVTPNGVGEWMHYFVYIDYNKDGVFTPNLDASNNYRPKADSELVSFDRYCPDLSQTSKTFYKSDGTAYSTGNPGYVGSGAVTLPTFTLPENLATGEYRIRLNRDWSSIDPCGITASGGTIASNGGAIVDFTLVIEEPEPQTHQVTVKVADGQEEAGTVAITAPAGAANNTISTEEDVVIEATANGDATFLFWTNTSDSKIETATYTYTGITDETFTAHFGYGVSYSVSGPGSIEIYADGEEFTPGDVFEIGTEIYMLWEPEDDNQLLSLSINGVNIVSETRENTEFYPEYSEAFYFVDSTANINILFGKPGDNTGLNMTNADNNAPVELYNLQGAKVNSENPAPGVYIRKQGNQVTKVVIGK